MLEGASRLPELREQIQKFGNEINQTSLQTRLVAALLVWSSGVFLAGIQEARLPELQHESQSFAMALPSQELPVTTITLPDIVVVLTPPTTSTLPEATTTTEPEPTTTLPIVPEVPQASPEPQQEVVEVPAYERTIWWSGQETPRDFIAAYLDKVPSLTQLAERVGNQFADADKQLAYIDKLANQTSPSVEGYRAFAVNTDYLGAFADESGYSETIQPSFFVIHWTAQRYPEGVEQYINSQHVRGTRVEYLIDRQATAYQFFDDTVFPAHALGANRISQGVEIETETYDENDRPQSPMYDFTAAQMEKAIYVAVEFCRRQNIPIDATTVVSHYSVDFLFRNKNYNPETGEFETMGNWDEPNELLQRVIIPKAQALDAALGPRQT